MMDLNTLDIRSQIEREELEGRAGLIWQDERGMGCTVLGGAIAQVVAGRVAPSDTAELLGISVESIEEAVQALDENAQKLLVLLADRRFPQCKVLEN